MQKQIFATVKIDMDGIGEKLKAVIEAKENLEKAIRDLQEAAGYEKTEVILHNEPIAASSFTVADGWQERPSYQRMS